MCKICTVTYIEIIWKIRRLYGSIFTNCLTYNLDLNRIRKCEIWIQSSMNNLDNLQCRCGITQVVISMQCASFHKIIDDKICKGWATYITQLTLSSPYNTNTLSHLVVYKIHYLRLTYYSLYLQLFGHIDVICCYCWSWCMTILYFINENDY